MEENRTYVLVPNPLSLRASRSKNKMRYLRALFIAALVVIDMVLLMIFVKLFAPVDEARFSRSRLERASCRLYWEYADEYLRSKQRFYCV